RGQSYEVNVSATSIASEADIRSLVAEFHAAHERRYGHKAVDECVEVVNFKVTAVGSISKPRLHRLATNASTTVHPIETRNAWFGSDASVATPVYRRSEL